MTFNLEMYNRQKTIKSRPDKRSPLSPANDFSLITIFLIITLVPMFKDECS